MYLYTHPVNFVVLKGIVRLGQAMRIGATIHPQARSAEYTRDDPYVYHNNCIMVFAESVNMKADENHLFQLCAGTASGIMNVQKQSNVEPEPGFVYVIVSSVQMFEKCLEIVKISQESGIDLMYLAAMMNLTH